MEIGEALLIVGPVAIVAAAIISGIVAWIGHKVGRKNAELSAEITKRNAEIQASLQSTVKLAQFRQKWIDEMRQDMAEFHALAITPGKTATEEQAFHEARCRIDLRINKTDTDYERLKVAVLQFYTTEDQQEKINATPAYLDVCQDILKREWEVLKKELRSVNFVSLDGDVS